MSNGKKPTPEAEKAPYQPTDREQAALDQDGAGVAAGPAAAPQTKPPKGKEAPKAAPPHPNQGVGNAQLKEALGTADDDFMNGLLGQLIDATARGKGFETRDLFLMLSVVKSIKPKDQLEAMLAAQMAAIHKAILRYARNLANAEILPQQDSAERGLNKLARTYAMQMEALKRYRTGGEQKVTVQHVAVNEGGQAIVGNVTQAARETAPLKPANETPTLTDARQPEMPIIAKPERAPLRREKDGGKSSA